MSASLDQQRKGQPNQVVNGNVKETVKDEEIEPYLQQPAHQASFQGGYSAAPMSSPGVNDPFMPSYYNQAMPFPYLSQGLTETGAWSSGNDPATMLSFGNYDYNSIFGGFGYPQFGWAPDYSGSDYWNNAQGRTDGRQYDYYQKDTMIPQDPYAAMNGGEFDVRDPTGMNSVDQGLKGMTISDKDGGQGVVGDQGHIDQNGTPMVPQTNGATSQPKKTTSWAAIASQPARPQPKIQPRSIPRAPMNPNKNMDIGTWDQRNNAGSKQGGSGGGQQGRSWSAPRSRTMNNYSGNSNSNQSGNSSAGNAGLSQITTSSSGSPASNHPVLEKLKSANQYNPRDFNLNPRGARFFIIKSYSEDDIHRSIKYSIWCSTDHGNKRLDQAFKEREGKGPIYLFYSVNGSGHFCGMAQMMSSLDYKNDAGVWAQDKWKGKFEVKWIYVKDVPNSQLRHIRLENNENKPVTNSRDTQEVPPEKGKQVLKIIHNYKFTTSIFDDFGHYEKRQEEDGATGTKPSSGGRDREQ